MSEKSRKQIPYEETYLGQLRQVTGKRKLISVGVRGIIVNAAGEVLLVERSDNGLWVMPAGGIELDESVETALRREVFEETGLTMTEATLIAIYSDPRYSIVTAYGDPYQIISFVFRVDAWQGEIRAETDETTNAKFFSLDTLPDNMPPMYHETLEDLQAFDGVVILK